MARRVWLSIFCLLLPLSGARAAGNAITISAALLPPHMDEQGGGRDADLIRAILEECGGYKVTFRVVPFGRHWSEYEAKQLDGVNMAPDGMALPGEKTVTYIGLLDGVVTLASTPPVARLADLAGRSAVTFPGGGEALGLTHIGLTRLIEQSDQAIHSNLLFTRRVDAIVADGLVIAEYNRRLQEHGATGQIDPSQPVRFAASFFEPLVYHLMLRDPVARERFDACYKRLDAAGRITAINKRYVDRYRDTVGSAYMGY